MNLTDFAYQLLDTQQELSQLRERNAYLEIEVERYRQDMSDNVRQHEENFGKILTAALDPDSHINKRMRGEV
jgi:regulator of replication initiation timing